MHLKAANKASTRRALRTPAFWAPAVCFTAYYATFAALTLHLVPLMLERQIPNAVILFSLRYGGANGMMTILRGTIVQDVMWTEGYGAISGLLSMPSNIAKGIAPISAAAIWSAQHNYLSVEWMILLASLALADAPPTLYVADSDARHRQYLSDNVDT